MADLFDAFFLSSSVVLFESGVDIVELVCLKLTRSVCHLVSQSINQPTNQPINQSINHSVSQSVSQLVN